MTQTVHTVLLYSDRPEVRQRMRNAIGTARSRPGGRVRRAATYDECVSLVDDYRIDLLLLDGEAQPAGASGWRQLRGELTAAHLSRSHGQRIDG